VYLEGERKDWSIISPILYDVHELGFSFESFSLVHCTGYHSAGNYPKFACNNVVSNVWVLVISV
jgi:hypothetical protein